MTKNIQDEVSDVCPIAQRGECDEFIPGECPYLDCSTYAVSMPSKETSYNHPKNDYKD